MKLFKYIAVGITAIIVSSSLAQAGQPAQDVNIHIGLGTGAEDKEVPLDSAGTVSGKIIGTTVFAVATGASMAAALPLVKNSEALTSLYVVVAGVLIYSQWQTIKKVFGPTYTDFATWVSTVSMVGFGLGSLALIDGKKPTIQDKDTEEKSGKSITA